MVGLLNPGALSAPPADPSASVTVLHRCVMEYDQDTAIGTTSAGVLGECFVREGDRVKAGQVLGRLQDDSVRAELQLREAAVKNDVEVRLAKAKNALVSSKLERTSALLRKGAVSREEFAQHKLEANVSTVEMEQAEFRQEMAGYQLEQTKAARRMLELVSPHDGLVVEVRRRKAEPVGLRDEVFHVINPERLRVVGLVDIADFGKIKVGQKARVIPEVAGVDLPIEHESFEGSVVFLDQRIDPVTRSCKVHVLVTNREGMLQGGLEARIEIESEIGKIAAKPATPITPVPLKK